MFFPGTQGLIEIYDKNKNGYTDMSGSGMPTEDYGVSNNPINFGSPQWSEAKFKVGNVPVIMEVRL